jgi:hypothetical protein
MDQNEKQFIITKNDIKIKKTNTQKNYKKIRKQKEMTKFYVKKIKRKKGNKRGNAIHVSCSGEIYKLETMPMIGLFTNQTIERDCTYDEEFHCVRPKDQLLQVFLTQGE